MQRGSMGFEVPESESAGDAGLKEIARLAARREHHLPVGPAFFGRRERFGAGDAWQRGRIGLGAQAHASRQQGPGLFLIAIENFRAAGEHDEAGAEPLGVLHDVGGENDRGAAAGRGENFILEHGLVHGIEAGEGFIEQEEFWRIDQSGGELDFLGHAL